MLDILTTLDQISWLQSDMGNAGVRYMGFAEAPVTIKESADFVASKTELERTFLVSF